MFIKLLILANETHDLDLKVIGHVRSHEKAKTILGEYLDNKSLTLVDGSLESIDVPCDYILHGGHARVRSSKKGKESSLFI